MEVKGPRWKKIYTDALTEIIILGLICFCYHACSMASMDLVQLVRPMQLLLITLILPL
jgi:hypothetical protein